MVFFRRGTNGEEVYLAETKVIVDCPHCGMQYWASTSQVRFHGSAAPARDSSIEPAMAAAQAYLSARCPDHGLTFGVPSTR